jgi:amidase
VTGEIGPYSTAVEMLAALRARQVSSMELVDMHVARIEEFDGALNAVPVRTIDRARESARQADAAMARGERGALLGLPMTLKESTQVAGLAQSAGIEGLKDYRPATDGTIASRVFAAGACLLGKTNIPVALLDWQADSPVYGRTNNPWDRERTPGGSTGGGGAALASGMTPLEIGSDIGGSVRVPAAFCGLYGHRPSETAVPRSGAFPFADRDNPAFVMGVHGPLARSAADAELLFDVIAGPVVGEDAGWQLAMPPSRHEALGDFRVAVMPPLPWVAPAAELRSRVDELAGVLSDAGAVVAEALPAVDLEQYFVEYLTLLYAVTSQGQSRAEREAEAAALRPSEGPLRAAMAAGMTLDACDYLALVDRRELARAAWRAFFTEWDVLVGPITLDAAFPHQTGDNYDRTLRIDDRDVPYVMGLVYPMLSIFAGQPATAFPAGLTAAGLPLGLQAVGPYLEDHTTLTFAKLLEQQWHGFIRPPGY